jgi:hypothetical protein
MMKQANWNSGASGVPDAGALELGISACNSNKHLRRRRFLPRIRLSTQESLLEIVVNAKSAVHRRAGPCRALRCRPFPCRRRDRGYGSSIPARSCGRGCRHRAHGPAVGRGRGSCTPARSPGSTCARVSDAEGVGRAEPGTFRSKPAPPRGELEPSLAARDLAGLERYERRALSRRKRASCDNQNPAVNGNPKGAGFASCAAQPNLELTQDGYTTKFQFLAERTQIPRGVAVGRPKQEPKAPRPAREAGKSSGRQRRSVLPAIAPCCVMA